MDMEKVKKGIKACWSECFSHKCYDCPYKDIRGENGCVKRLGEDVLELLKEQEKRIDELEEKLRLLEYGDLDTLQGVMMPAT